MTDTKTQKHPPRQYSSRAAREHGTPRTILFVGFDGFQVLDIAGPLEVFNKANHHMPETTAKPFRYELIVASPSGGVITSGSGMQIAGTRALGDLDEPLDTVMIAGGPEAALRNVAANTGLLKWIAGRAPDVRRVASVCTGAFLLAECGLLNGRRATTHWSATKALEAMLPKTEVVPDAILVGDGYIFTSAGVRAGIDLALAFVAHDCGPGSRSTRHASWYSIFGASVASPSSAPAWPRKRTPPTDCMRSSPLSRSIPMRI